MVAMVQSSTRFKFQNRTKSNLTEVFQHPAIKNHSNPHQFPMPQSILFSTQLWRLLNLFKLLFCLQQKLFNSCHVHIHFNNYYIKQSDKYLDYNNLSLSSLILMPVILVIANCQQPFKAFHTWKSRLHILQFQQNSTIVPLHELM
jgi:hypothetical protein